MDAHKYLKVMEEEDLLGGMPEGTRVCVCACVGSLWRVCSPLSLCSFVSGVCRLDHSSFDRGGECGTGSP